MRSCVCVFCLALRDLNFSACSIPPSDIHGGRKRKEKGVGGGGERLGGLDRYEMR